MNLEDWKELKGKVTEGAKKIWEAIKKAFAWIMEQIKKLAPTRNGAFLRIKSRLNGISVSTNSKEYKEALTNFKKEKTERFAGVARMLEKPETLNSINNLLNNVVQVLSYTITKNGEQNNKLKTIESFGISVVDYLIKKADSAVVAIVPEGNRIIVKQIAGEDLETQPLNMENVELNVQQALGYIDTYLRVADSIKKNIEKADGYLKQLSPDFDSKAAKKLFNSVIKMYNVFNTQIFNYIKVYSAAVVSASDKKDNQKK